MSRNIFLLADYPAGVEIVRFLKERGENIVGLAMPPSSAENDINRGAALAIRDALNIPPERIFSADDIASESGRAKIKALAPDIALSIYWGEILPPEFLALFPETINMHLSYLPYNRGANPNVWAIVEGTPAGVTLHTMDQGADTGAVIAQKAVEKTSIDTGKSIYEKLSRAAVTLFKETWPSIAAGTHTHTPQSGTATAHLRKDFHKLARIDLDAPTTARAVIDHLRAKTFPPFPGAAFTDESGREVQVRIELQYSDDHEKEA